MVRAALLALSVACLVALPLLAGFMQAPSWIGIATRILIFALAAVGLHLVVGYGGMISFGHAAFVGVGAYTVAILGRHAGDAIMLGGISLGAGASAFVAWPAAALAAGCCAFFVGLVSLRTTGIYFVVVTLALGQMIYLLFRSLERYGGANGIRLDQRSGTGELLDLNNPVSFYYVVLAILALVVALCARIVRARFGRVIEGVRENERRMQALGFPTYRYKLACFTLSGAIAGVAGALLANFAEVVSPAFLHWTRSGELIVMVFLGGVGTLFGPVLGAICFMVLEELLSAYTQHWMIIFGPLLILVALFARPGLLGMISVGPGDRR